MTSIQILFAALMALGILISIAVALTLSIEGPALSTCATRFAWSWSALASGLRPGRLRPGQHSCRPRPTRP